MKKQTWIMIGIILLLGFLLLNQCSVNKEQDDLIEVLEKEPDTVYRKTVMKVIKPYKVVVKPDKVIVYQDTGRIVYRDLVINGSSIVLFNTGSLDSLIINKNFLSKFPNNKKLIAMDLTNKELKLQLLNLSGISTEERYNINTSKYNYRYVDNSLTMDKKFQFNIEPEVSYSYRPLNNFHDLDIALNFKTSRFNYKFGANGFLYPKFNAIGYDAKVTVQYTFK